jgi:hypothetical protein
MTKAKEHQGKACETSPVRQLERELHTLRRELRTIVRVYSQRLEHELLASTKALRRYQPAEKLSREQLHCIRDFAIMVRQRRFRPEKGRRKDLRKIDSLISELRPLTDVS